MTRCLLLFLILAADPATASEEAGAKAMFGDPSLGVLQFSPIREPKPAGKGHPAKSTKKPARNRESRVSPELSSAPLPPSQSSALDEGAARSIGLRFWVQQVDGEGKILGEMGVGQVFRSGERIQLIVESNTAGYLAIVQQGADGRAGLLFPSHESELGAKRIPAHTKVVLPGANHSFTFDETPGTERLLLVLTRDRQEFSALPLRREMRQEDLAAVRRLGSHELGAKNLTVQAFADPKEDPATYVVNRTGSGIVQEIALVHEK